MSNSARRFIPACIALALLAGSTVAGAHSDEWLEHHAPHGGQLKDCGPYHIEMTSSGDKLIAYVYNPESFEKIPTAGWTAEAFTLADDKRSQTKLVPVGVNGLQGQASGSHDPRRKVVLVVHPRAGQTYTARYTPGTVTAPAGTP